MTDSTDRPTPVSRVSEDVGHLLRAAGRRPKIEPARLDRMREELRPLWVEQRQSEMSHRSWLRLAAAVGAIAIVSLFVGRLSLAPDAIEVARVERLDGSAAAWAKEQASSRTTSLEAGGVVLEGATVSTTETSRVALRATVGHSIRLDLDTRVSFLSARELRLEHGAIYLDSGSETANPRTAFTIHTALGSVEEIGTQFEVRLAASSLRVRVREGVVVLTSDSGKYDGRAGEELISEGSTVTKQRFEPSGDPFAWVKAMVPNWALDGDRLIDFLKLATREGGYRLRYSEPAIEREAATVIVRGEVEGLTPEAALDAVLPAVGLTHEFEGSELWVRRWGAPPRDR